ncbi:MAG TPA: hypothetical protein VGJ15_08180 [Pirellulales bacterium]|jgi:hypothetical protein
MSKRTRKSTDKKDGPPAKTTELGLSQDEPKLVVAGEAFAKFEAFIEQQLQLLENRWIHTAAPNAARVRRVMSQESRRISDEA